MGSRRSDPRICSTASCARHSGCRRCCENYSISLAAASKHIKALENAGLIRREVRGRTHLCRLEPGPLASAHEWLNYYKRYWSDRLDRLEQILLEEDAAKSKSPPRKGDDQ